MIRNTFVIFLVSGFWHGANWTFILWGAFHAVLFLPLLLGGRNRKHLTGIAEDRWYPTFGELGMMLKTFALAMAGWLVFRAQSISELLRWAKDLVNPFCYGKVDSFPDAGNAAFVSIAILLALEWFCRREQFALTRLPSLRWLRWLVYFGLVVLIFIYAPGSHAFIYFQF